MVKGLSESSQKTYTPDIRMSKHSKPIRRFFDDTTAKLEQLYQKKETINSLKNKLNILKLREKIKEKEEYKKPEYQYPPAERVLGPVQLQQHYLEQNNQNPGYAQNMLDQTCNMFSQL